MKTEELLAVEGGPKAVEEPVPFGGYGAELIGEEEEACVLEALRSRKLCRITHPFADSFAHRLEEALGQRLKSPYVHVVNSCASALHAALVALEVGPGDEVLVASAGWFSVAAATIDVGAVPVAVDYDESLSLDVDDLERKITPRSVAVIVVHWRGLPANMKRLLSVARRHNLKVIEDVAQSFGASYGGEALGTLGDIGCFSFNMHKIVSGGEGGAIATRHGDLYKRVVSFSGMYNLYKHKLDDGERQGMPRAPMLNYRMPELCAAVAFAQLGKLEAILGTLRARSLELRRGIAEIDGLVPAPRHDAEGECGYTVPLIFESAERARFFFEAMRAEGATNVSSAHFGFGGGEAKGTASLVASQGLDPSESGQMPFAHTWRCMTERVPMTRKLDPWRLAYGDGDLPAPPASRTFERLARVVALKTNVLMQPRHTEAILRAARKVAAALARSAP